MSVTGDADGDPVRVGIAVADYFAGLFTLSGILLALQARERMGVASRWTSRSSIRCWPR